LDGLAQRRQRFGTNERRCEEFVRARDLDPALARCRKALASTMNLVIGTSGRV
jgi:hypothetical protein